MLDLRVQVVAATVADVSEPVPLPVAVAPRSASWIEAAVEAGGGQLVAPERAEAIVWTRADDPDGLAELLVTHPHIGWVQLPWAGVDPYLRVMDADRSWTCAKGVYSEPVAEHALAMILAGFRQLHTYSRTTSWTAQAGRNLLGAKVTIVGGGGIASSLIRMLGPFGTEITVVRRTDAPMNDVARVLVSDGLHDGLRDADAVVLALPLLEENRGLIGARELALLAPGAWLVNVARGAHVDHDALVASLDAGHLGGAALDVTDPEPLPDDHPLWSRPEVIITPHTANTREMARPLLGRRITENVRRRRAGEQLAGVVDLDAGY